MQSSPLDRIVNILMFTVLLLTMFVMINVMAFLLFSSLVLKGASPLLYLLMQLVLTGAVTWFCGKKLYAPLLLAPADVPLPRFTAYFVGALRGILLAGAAAWLAGVVLFIAAPERLFHPEMRTIVTILCASGGVTGLFFPAETVAKRTRVWLLLSLVAEFFLAQVLGALLLLRPVTFRYRAESARSENYPALGSKLVARCLPNRAGQTEITGSRGVRTLFYWRSEVSPDALDEFSLANNYRFTADDPRADAGLFAPEFLAKLPKHYRFYADKGMALLYDPDAETLYGLYLAEVTLDHAR